MSVDNPRTLDPHVHVCECVSRHVPALKATHEHHIVPLGWRGPDTEANVVPLCPNSHDAYHRLLNAYRRHGHEPPDAHTYNRHVRSPGGRGLQAMVGRRSVIACALDSWWQVGAATFVVLALVVTRSGW